MDKWKLGGLNRRIPGFELESECFAWLEELQKLWTDLSNSVRRWRPEGKSTEERAAADDLCRTTFSYCRVGYDERAMTFLPDGTVGAGAADCELYWDLHTSDGHEFLSIFSSRALTCELRRNGDQTWIGRWGDHEKMPIELKPTG